jgi:hypothetical protein
MRTKIHVLPTRISLMKDLMLPGKMDPTSLVVNSIVPCVLEYHNLILSTHLIIVADVPLYYHLFKPAGKSR